MSNQTTQQYLEHAASYNNPTVSLDAVHEFMRSGDVKNIDRIPADWRYNEARDLTRLAVAEKLSTPASQAVFDVAVHRISTGDHTRPDMFPAVFALQCVEIAQTDAGNDVGSKLLYALRDCGVDDITVALFWITSMSETGPAPFVWEHGNYYDSALLEADKYFRLPQDIAASNIFEELILGLSDTDMTKLLQCYKTAAVKNGQIRWSIGALQGIVARDRPQILGQFIDSLPDDQLYEHVIDWRYVVGATEQFDEVCLHYCKQHGLVDPVIVLDILHAAKYAEIATKLCVAYDGSAPQYAMAYLEKINPDLLLQKLSQIIDTAGFGRISKSMRCRYCLAAVESWDTGGSEVYSQFEYSYLHNPPREQQPKRPDTDHAIRLLKSHLREALVHGALFCQSPCDGADQWLLGLLDSFPEDAFQKTSFYSHLGRIKPYLIEDELWQSLQHRLSRKREETAEWLNHDSIQDTISKVKPLLEGKADAQFGAIALLTNCGDEASKALLLEAFEKKQSAKVRSKLAESLKILGHELTAEDLMTGQSAENVLAGIEKGKAMRLPKSTTSWLKVQDLPNLKTKDSIALSEKAITNLICIQAKHKTIDPAPDNIVLLSLIDKELAGDFACEILTQWLASACDSKDKWVMTLAGLLGDRRVLPALTDPIQGWAKNSRYKLAEHAASAVSLVPSKEALMLLDLLATRYRSRYRNIGKACRAALDAAAESQGVTMDELGDMIVPTLEFDTDCQRNLPDTPIVALLQADFKMTFHNPETDKETKTPPASLPDNAKAEITAVKKLITKMVKQQTLRLEQALVRQRRWKTTRWQEFFEVNPFLQSYASRLVWVTMDQHGEQQKLFRRYPNGLLANAAGDLIELDDTDSEIVLVHPLSLDEDTLQSWKEHLTRMKVKQPFAQLGRPVAHLDTAQGNRKSIAFTDQQKIPVGTLRSRAEKLGWEVSSWGGGRIDSFCKVYVGAEVGVFLKVENAYLGQDPTTAVTLGPALFVNSEPVKSGAGFTGEAQNADSENVMAFSEVPASIYSETITDLERIVAVA